MLLCLATNPEPKPHLLLNPLLRWQEKAKSKPRQDRSKCWCVHIHHLPACVSRWPIHNFRKLFFPLKCGGYSPSFVYKLSKNPSTCPALSLGGHKAAGAESEMNTHTNTGWCPHSHVHLLAFSQSILEHASTAMPEIILANSTADEIRLPKKSFDFSDLRARKKDPIIW